MSRWLFRIAMISGLAALLGCAHQPRNEEGSSRVEIEVTESGFTPAVVTIPANQPATLVVTRKTNATCATDFVMKSQSINKPLPLNQAVEIQIPAQSGGELEYACAMDMFKGKIKVKK